MPGASTGRQLEEKSTRISEAERRLEADVVQVQCGLTRARTRPPSGPRRRRAASASAPEVFSARAARRRQGALRLHPPRLRPRLADALWAVRCRCRREGAGARLL